jgi:Ring finger domain
MMQLAAEVGPDLRGVATRLLTANVKSTASSRLRGLLGVLAILCTFIAAHRLYRAARRALASLRAALHASARRSQQLRGSRAAAARRALRRALDVGSPETVCDAAPPCAVCLERIATGQLVRTLACAHVFHSACVERLWASAARRTCPLCRLPLIA